MMFLTTKKHTLISVALYCVYSLYLAVISKRNYKSLKN
jgi:hypothetical protein